MRAFALRNKLWIAVLISLALGIAGTASTSAQEDAAQIWPMAWQPIFEDVTPETNMLTNLPLHGMILPFDKVQWPKAGLGPKEDGAFTTYLIGDPKADPPGFYIVYRVWGPGRRMGEDVAHWHREKRAEVMIFGHGYSIGFNRTFDPKMRESVGPGDGFVEMEGGRHFGFSDYPDIGRNPARNVMYLFGTPRIVDKQNESANPKDHGWVYYHDKIAWEPATGTGPMIWRFIGDARQAGYYAEFNKWGPGSGLPAHTYSNDVYGMVVSGTLYLSYGDNPDPHDGLPYRRMTQGTFFTVPAGIAHSIYTQPNATQDAVVYMVGNGPSTLTRLEPSQQ
jgi:hypothetical protein